MNMKRAFKGFDENMQCRGFQFEVGKTYHHEGPVKICNSGFHFCKDLVLTFEYYKPPRSIYAIIEYDADNVDWERPNKHKGCSGTIKIIKILDNIKDYIDDKENSGNRNSGNYNSGNRNSGNYNSGNRNSGNYNSGNYNSGNCNSGYNNSGNRNSGNRNSGNYNSGYCNSGNCNSGYCNSGDCNSGNYNSGDFNSGYNNSGYRNSGDSNSGDYNSGNYNSGNFNTSNYNTGHFNTKPPELVYVFNKPLAFDVFINTNWDILFTLDKEQCKHLPNFDEQIFDEIVAKINENNND